MKGTTCSRVFFHFDEDEQLLKKVWQEDYKKVIDGMCFALARTFSFMLPLIKVLMCNAGHVNAHNIQLVVVAGVRKRNICISLHITPDSDGIMFNTGFYTEIRRPRKLMFKPEYKDIPHGMPSEWGNMLLVPLIKDYKLGTARNGLPRSLQAKLPELAKIFQHNEPQAMNEQYYAYSN